MSDWDTSKDQLVDNFMQEHIRVEGSIDQETGMYKLFVELTRENLYELMKLAYILDVAMHNIEDQTAEMIEKYASGPGPSMAVARALLSAGKMTLNQLGIKTE